MKQAWVGVNEYLDGTSRAHAALVVALAVVAGVLEAVLLILVVSGAVGVADDTARVEVELPLAGEQAMSVGSVLGFATAAGVVILMVHACIAWLTARLASKALHSVRREAITAFVGASWERQSVDREGALQETSSTLAVNTASLLLHFGSLATGVAGLVVLLSAALFVSPPATAVVVVFGGCLFVLLRPIGRRTRRLGRRFTTSNSLVNESLTQWSGLAMELRVFGVEDAEASRMIRLSEHASQAMARSGFMGRFGSDLFKDVAILFLVAAVGLMSTVDAVPLASTGAVVLLIVRSLSYAQMTNSAAQTLNEKAANLEALQERMRSLRASQQIRGRRSMSEIGTIEFEDVSYDYPGARLGVRDVTLAIAPGEAIGIIGPSGGGKSTLTQVLLRLRTPTHGRVVAGGLDYVDIDANAWNRMVALVPQEPRLFEGTVADNISFFRKGFSRDEIEVAAAAAHVADDIRSLPNSFDTRLGPRGDGISGGQKQRIAIARALLGNPQLLVLDEPTSALDVRSEQMIRAAIEEMHGKTTMVIVAHRLTTLSCCDRVVAMDGGEIKGVGTLAEALRRVELDNELLDGRILE